jgi:hypothetical protein
MNDELKSIADEYTENVKKVCLLMLKAFNLRSKGDLLKYRALHQIGEFELNGNNKYFFHGRGCLFSNQDIKIDWDFGYGSRWCGLDPWFIANYIKDNLKNSSEFSDGNKIQKEFEQAVTNGEMIKKYGMFYFTIPAIDTFQPDFPKEYDILIVEYYGVQRIIKRNKKVDKFIRKSRRVSKKIGEGPEVYNLRFLKEGKQIYSIPYDDIGYPERSVLLMNELMKENYEE